MKFPKKIVIRYELNLADFDLNDVMGAVVLMIGLIGIIAIIL